MKKLIPLMLTAVAFRMAAQGQTPEPKAMHYTIVDGDTLPHVNIETVTVRQFKNKRKQIKYNKLMYNVKKAYPYAVAARDELAYMNSQLAGIEDKEQQEEYVKNYEKLMFKRYEKELRALTISQGRILIKLVDDNASKIKVIPVTSESKETTGRDGITTTTVTLTPTTTTTSNGTVEVSETEYTLYTE